MRTDITFLLAGYAHALAVKYGAVLIQSEKLCNSGSPESAKQLTRLAGEINRLTGMLNSLYYTAKLALTDAEFDDFCRLSKIDRALIEDGLRDASEEFTNCHYELSEN